MEIGYHNKCIDDIESLCQNNKINDKILRNAIEEFKSINFDKALKKREVAPLNGVEKSIKKLIEENGYLPSVFEYRNFPGSHPFRIIFVIKNTKDYAILVATSLHGKMNSHFNEMFEKRIKSLFRL
jgi:hypothetical protein